MGDPRPPGASPLTSRHRTARSARMGSSHGCPRMRMSSCTGMTHEASGARLSMFMHTTNHFSVGGCPSYDARPAPSRGASSRFPQERHVGTSPNLEAYDPDLWVDEQAFLDRPGQRDIQTDLFDDYRTNVQVIRLGRRGCGRTSPRCLCSGATTIRRSSRPKLRHTCTTYPVLSCTCWMLDTSPWTSVPMRSPI